MADGLAPALISAVISASVAGVIWQLGRHSERRNAAIEQFKIYYSHEMREARRSARLLAESLQTFSATKGLGIEEIDVYESGFDQDQVDGYSKVISFFHLIGILYEKNEISKTLIRQMLAREYGWWDALLFTPMENRADWWTRVHILPLRQQIKTSDGHKQYDAGFKFGQATIEASKKNQTPNPSVPG